MTSAHDILSKAASLIDVDRQQDYGDFVENMEAYAVLKSAYQSIRRTKSDDAHQAVMDMVLLKLMRIARGQVKLDTYCDAAAYLAMAGQIATQSAPANVVPIGRTA